MKQSLKLEIYFLELKVEELGLIIYESIFLKV